MKSLSPSQLEALLKRLEELKGRPLQKILASDRDLVLGLWTERGMSWIWIDLKPPQPYLALLEDLPGQELKKKPPVLNFLGAHAKGLNFEKVELRKEWGRVLRFQFGPFESGLSLEVRLIPHAPNVILNSKDKQVSWAPVKDLVPFEWNSQLQNEEDLASSVEKWRQRFKRKSTAVMTPEQIQSRYEKELAKSQKALNKIEEDLKRKQDPIWRNLGEWIKTHQSLQVPPEWRSLIEPEQSLSYNIERCFRKAKDNEAKLSGTHERYEKIQKELENLKNLGPEKWWAQARRPQTSSGPRFKTNFKARSFELEEGLRAYFGKSGKDNLSLLRQARAWDYWVHLKDEPGSHGVIFRKKNQELNSLQWERVGCKLVEASLGEKAKSREGDRFEMLVCEIRYVKPIKGDRLGRVNYQNEKVVGFSYHR